MHVIATAGHVDHGKSALVQRLTGIDPDRLEEEKRRGLTIDLGFAWLSLPSGSEIGIIDVPGHERFIKNMLAGVGSIDAVLFVVAANEGWKPQSQEHLDILDLLEVSNGVVALTKSDTVSNEELRARTLEIQNKIGSTSLSGAPIKPVSAITDDGLDSLIEELDTVVAGSRSRPDEKRPRLHVDRVFSMHGSGTVLTGTLEGGKLAEQDEVVILPSGDKARIRSIQTHKKKIDVAEPGRRVALNLTGLKLGTIARGDVVSHPGMWEPTSKLIVDIRFLPHLAHTPAEKGAYKLYLGATEQEARLRFLGPAPSAGGSVTALLTTRSPVVADWKDRFVLREAGRRLTVGGGSVLEPHAKDIRIADALSVANKRAGGSRAAYASSVVDEVGVISRATLKRRTGMDPGALDATVVLPSYAVSARLVAEINDALTDALRAHHHDHPLDPGMPLEKVRAIVEPLLVAMEAFEEFLSSMHEAGTLAWEGTAVRLRDHRPAVDEGVSLRVIEEVRRHGSSPPSIADLQQKFDPSLIKALIRSGRLVQVSPTLAYPESWLEQLKETLRQNIEEQGPFTVAAFRDLVGTTRKYAVPLVEYLDSIGFTRRDGDLRVLGPKARAATPPNRAR